MPLGTGSPDAKQLSFTSLCNSASSTMGLRPAAQVNGSVASRSRAKILRAVRARAFVSRDQESGELVLARERSKVEQKFCMFVSECVSECEMGGGEEWGRVHG